MLVTLDFETYYGPKYSLSLQTMNLFKYVADEQFMIHGVGVKIDDQPTTYYDFRSDEQTLQFRALLTELKAERVELLAQNTAFDGFILHYYFDWHADYYADTMAMSRGLFPGRPADLKSLATRLWPGNMALRKGEDLKLTYGVRELSDGISKKLGAYCIQDVELTYAAFKMLEPHYPDAELDLIDWTIRALVQPVLHVNRDLVQLEISEQEAYRKQAIASCGVSESVLKSDKQFCELLVKAGVQIETKRNAKDTADIPALGQKDWPYLKMVARHPELAPVWKARKVAKSNIQESRARWFDAVAEWNGGMMPIALNYYGAETGRWSGGEKLNCFSAGHELLTPDGWVAVEEYTPGKPLMQWATDGALSFDNSPSFLRKEYTGRMVNVEAPMISARVTEDHRFVSVRGTRLVDRTAGWIADHSGLDGLPTAGVFNNPEPANTSPAQARLLVCLAADGHVNAAGAVIFGFKRVEKIQRCRKLLQECGLKFTECTHPSVSTLRVGRNHRPEWLQKGVGAWCLSLSAEAQDAVLDELVYWDGGMNSRSGQPTFYTTLEHEADWVVTLARLRGRGATKYVYPRDTKSGVICHVYFRQNHTTSIDTRRQVTTDLTENEVVYCPGVNTSYVLVRRNGRVYVAGNCQNLPRIDPDDPATGRLRKALVAPPGEVIIVRDLNNIEGRMLAWLAAEEYLLELFRNDGCPYLYMAESIYGAPHGSFTKQTHKGERNVGKVAVLGLGYGMSANKFWVTVNTGPMGMDPIPMSFEQCQSIVNIYRMTNLNIARYWDACNGAISWMAALQPGEERQFGPLTLMRDMAVMPNGMALQYPGLHGEPNAFGGHDFFFGANGTRKIYGAHATENFCQALSRVLLGEQKLTVQGELDTNYGRDVARIVHSVHDELLVVAPERYADDIYAMMGNVMSTTPAWATGLPLKSEGGYALEYSK